MEGYLRMVLVLSLSILYQVVQGQDDICKNVACPRGRVCVPNIEDSGKRYTRCECIRTCYEEERAPVCSYYDFTFTNACEMHKFGCAHGLTMRVKRQGRCEPPGKHSCIQILQFPTRYLEWIMIAREQSLDPAYSLNFSARADALTEMERNEILSWEFEYIDTNLNGTLDRDEIDRLYKDVLNYEPCIYGFLESCDQNGDERITKREWDSSFPLTLSTALETKK